MDLITMIAVVLIFPWGCLAFLLWMAWLEDRLPGAISQAQRAAAPPPIVALPVRRDETAARTVDTTVQAASGTATEGATSPQATPAPAAEHARPVVPVAKLVESAHVAPLTPQRQAG
jgi:hypothetical protein